MARYNLAMPIIDTDQLLRTAEEKRRREHDRAKAITDAADQEYNAVVRAVQTVLGQPAATPSAVRPSVEQAVVGGGRVFKSLVRPAIEVDIFSKPLPDAGLTDCLRWAIRHFTGEFTTPQLAEFLERHGYNMTERRDFMASCMVKLTDKREVVKVRNGSGRSPSVFRRTDATNDNGHGLKQETLQTTLTE